MIATQHLGQFGRRRSTPLTDAAFADVVLQLHCDGADASTTFTDTSSFARTVTANGNAQVDTAQSKFGGASLLLDGTGDYLSTPDAASLEFALSDFTVELFFRAASLHLGCMIGRRQGASGIGWELLTSADGSLVFQCKDGTPNFAQSAASAYAANTWYHIAVSRFAGMVRMFLDGVLIAATGSPTFTVGATELRVGSRSYFDFLYFNGHIDEVRLTNKARYIADFTPPSGAFPDS